MKSCFGERSDVRPFVDIHCHIAAGIDDGPADWDESLRMAETALTNGIGTIIVTPHQLGRYSQNSAATIRKAVEHLQSLLDKHELPLRVLPGADVRVEPDLPAKIANGDVLTLADGRQYVLLELPHEVYLPLERVLAELERVGLTSILSHPERNQGIIHRPEVVHQLAEQGCLLQLTAGSLTGEFGSTVQKFAEMLLREGLVHFIATDAHRLKHRAPCMKEAFFRAVGLVGEETAVELCCRNPEAITSGKKLVNSHHKGLKPEKSPWFCKSLSLIHS